VSGFLIDTNVISEFAKAKPESRVIQWLDNTDSALLFVSVVTLGELRLGICELPEGKRRRQLEDWLSQGLPSWFESNLLPVSKAFADGWGRMAAEAKQQGIHLTTTDGQIAATAKAHDLTLVTRNIKDFSGLGVELLNPWEA
jgi:predicted nucleic acid-binding protein